MPGIAVRLLRQQKLGNVFHTSRRTADRLALKPGIYRIHAGQSSTVAELCIQDEGLPPATIQFGAAQMDALKLGQAQRCLMWWDKKDRVLRVGPVLGVLALRTGRGVRAFGESTDIVRDCVRVAHRRGFVAYAFSVVDINWDNSTVNGWFWQGNTIQRAQFPLPDVIYDRIASRNAEASTRISLAKDKLLSMPRVQYYNRAFLNKWDVHLMLMKHQGIRRHLPATELLTDVSNLKHFVTKYPTVFVKPVDGSLGARILRISRTGNGFCLRYTRLDKPDLHTKLASISQVLKVSERFCTRQRYIVQRGLRLARINGGPFDVRVLLQKTTQGRWIVHSMVARVAQPGNIVSNLADGGQIVSPRCALRSSFGGSLRPTTMTARMGRLARSIAAVVERELGYELAELGVDLGVDASGRLWVIEVNSRPSRQTTNESSKHRISGSIRRLVRFLGSRAMQSGSE